MVMTTEENKYLLRNLRDAGCDGSIIEKFLLFQKEGRIKEQFHLLSQQRTLLLEKVHDNQKKIDCLDFLVFNMKEEKKK